MSPIQSGAQFRGLDGKPGGCLLNLSSSLHPLAAVPPYGTKP